MKPGTMTLQEVADLLEAMQDADGVAFLLAMHDVKGKRQVVVSCPIAVFASQAVGATMAAGFRSLWSSGDAARCVLLPDCADEFIRRFDKRLYPQLEAGR